MSIVVYLPSPTNTIAFYPTESMCGNKFNANLYTIPFDIFALNGFIGLERDFIH
jgi:hypothetical protein